MIDVYAYVDMEQKAEQYEDLKNEYDKMLEYQGISDKGSKNKSPGL